MIALCLVWNDENGERGFGVLLGAEGEEGGFFDSGRSGRAADGQQGPWRRKHAQAHVPEVGRPQTRHPRLRTVADAHRTPRLVLGLRKVDLRTLAMEPQCIHAHATTT